MNGNKIWVIGDASVDLVPDEAGRYLKCPGGASANVAVSLARLDARCAFIGRLGLDPVGHFLAQILRREGVDIAQLKLDPQLKTAVLMVELADDGERTFSYLVTPGADSFVCCDDLPAFSAGEWFYFNSIGLTREPSRTACLTGAGRIRSAGGFVLFDVNLREAMWPDRSEIKPQIEQAIALADICKISADELCQLTATSDWRDARSYVRDLGCPVSVISLGAQGAYLINQGVEQHFPAVSARVVDTTGAGDAFVGGLLSELARLQAWRSSPLDRAINSANYCGAAAVTRRGAMTALPDAQALAAFHAAQTAASGAETITGRH
ncbi:aminoimidazole riboside kinase [Izhakiella australiensis]|uniref:Aminoimidazole riboside kinase n=1 Tax=Izhakiella australiensis TaxID=1926881 RepID=A0A1S8YE10_9GAMM|nr:aminoimidazole riboside kinase [Izhakiella australiensis]OON36998.1 aminoimidazole riboside kinase [Izhakiella australiensis]